jgi:hypothetical protein
VTVDALDRSGWGATVSVRSDEAVRGALLARQRAGPMPASISVTEVLDPRGAYWRRMHPVPATPERSARMRAGQEMHVLAGHLLAPASAREVRSRREGIVARIDLLDDRVTELKTTSLPASGARGAVRASYLQQLAVYCGLLERSEARLILIDTDAGPSPAVAAFDADFPEASTAWAEAVRRASQLRAALERRTPLDLPGCPWRDRGCEFQGAGVCDCTGREPMAPPDAFGALPPVVESPELGRRLSEALASGPASPPIRRFRDLLYPRRAYFERTVPLDGGEKGWTPPAGDRREDLWRQISDLVESGVAGEVAAVDPPEGDPLERVTTLAGRPMLLKTNRSWNPPSAERVLMDQVQYVLELALRCASIGLAAGTLILGYERLPDWERRLQVYQVEFDPSSTVRELREARVRGLRDALSRGDPKDLPACPAWMYAGCPYRPGCACSGDAGPGTDQR